MREIGEAFPSLCCLPLWVQMGCDVKRFPFPLYILGDYVVVGISSCLEKLWRLGEEVHHFCCNLCGSPIDGNRYRLSLFWNTGDEGAVKGLFTGAW